jgi:ATP-dependent DNA ligase
LPAERPPSGPDWRHEIKHDGFRIMARRDANGVRLYTRNGYNFASRFPQIVEAVSKLKVRSCLIDGEALLSTSAASQPLTCSAPGATTVPPCFAPSI